MCLGSFFQSVQSPLILLIFPFLVCVPTSLFAHYHLKVALRMLLKLESISTQSWKRLIAFLKYKSLNTN